MVIRVPFFLEPDYDDSVPFVETNRERLLKKWGGEAGWREQRKRHDLQGRGEAAGIPHFNNNRLASNTMKSHRLIQYVGKKFGLAESEELYDRLNVYHFVDGKALNDVDGLVDVTTDVLKLTDGGKEIRSFLNDPLEPGRKEIKEAYKLTHELGIHSIPNFVVGGKFIVSGAASPTDFLDVFEQVQEDGCSNPVFAKVLGVRDFQATMNE